LSVYKQKIKLQNLGVEPIIACSHEGDFSVWDTHVGLIRLGNGYFLTGFSCLGLKIPHLIILVLVDGLLDQF